MCHKDKLVGVTLFYVLAFVVSSCVLYDIMKRVEVTVLKKDCSIHHIMKHQSQ